MRKDEKATALARVREICVGLPETEERLSHGAPDLLRPRRSGRSRWCSTTTTATGAFAIWCAAGPGTQKLLIDADPEKFFRPPYVGHRGWLGVRLDRGLDWDEIAGILEDAYAEVAPPALLERRRPRHEAS